MGKSHLYASIDKDLYEKLEKFSDKSAEVNNALHRYFDTEDGHLRRIAKAKIEVEKAEKDFDDFKKLNDYRIEHCSDKIKQKLRGMMPVIRIGAQHVKDLSERDKEIDRIKEIRRNILNRDTGESFTQEEFNKLLERYGEDGNP